MSKKTASTAQRKARSAPPHGSAWVSVKDRLPKDRQRVIAIYQGVYDWRVVTFWKDGGGNPHFGTQFEADRNGSQPATHWHPLPKMPNVEAIHGEKGDTEMKKDVTRRWMRRFVRRLRCAIVGHVVDPCDQSGKSLMRRMEEGVEAECDHCGKTLRATCGLELCGLVWCRKPNQVTK